MLRSKVKIATAVVLAISVMGAGAGLFTYSPLRAAQEQERKARPGTDQPNTAAAQEGQANRTHSVKSMPPVVVRTNPPAGDTEVDAAKTNEIRVTFSKDMMDNSWSWVKISDQTFPQMNGKVRYDQDRRTCILPVKLEAGKTYVLWLNSDNFHNFKDADGNAAIPYLLVFETKR